MFMIKNFSTLIKLNKKGVIFQLCKRFNGNTPDHNKKVIVNQKRYNPEAIDKKFINIIDLFPSKIKSLLYLGRYDRFKAILLLYYPCTWGLTLGAQTINLVYFKYMGLFFMGSVLMRASGCIINDMWDKNLDKQVIRTQNRPLANDSISYKEAVLFLIPHLGISLAILLHLPLKSIALGLGIMPVVILYPLMKRFTYFPQIFLGICFNSGVIIAYPVLNDFIDVSVCIPFYTAGICWTLIYDTLYAHMDKLDDRQINVKSTALYLEERTKSVCYFLCMLMFILITYGLSRVKDMKNQENINKELLLPPTCLLLISILYQVNIVRMTNLNEPFSCLKSFQKSRNFGLLVFITCLIFKLNNKSEKIE